jgi:hypothetical protein
MLRSMTTLMTIDHDSDNNAGVTIVITMQHIEQDNDGIYFQADIMST